MNGMEAGTYRGSAEGLTFDFRVQKDASGGVSTVSGDVLLGDRFLATLICASPEQSDDGRTLTGAVRLRGHPLLYSGRLRLYCDPRGTGSFEVAVDLEGGHSDVFAGRLEWAGGSLRRLMIEIDGIEGTGPPSWYTTQDGTEMTVLRAFELASFDVTVLADTFRGGPGAGRARGYTLAEIHAAMEERRSAVPGEGLHAHVFVCSYLAGRGNRGVLGIMYDFGESDLNQRPREGVAVFYDHPMLSDPRVSEADRNREYVFTMVHEVGHALNLLHSFDKGRPAALSWMNYPDLYPRGTQAGPGHDGTREFWRRFEGRFDEQELRHLLHATPREIQAGGFPFGVYEEGPSWPFGGPAEPRRTPLGANPLRASSAAIVKITPLKDEYDLGEPVFLRIAVENLGHDAIHVPDALDPSEGYVHMAIRTPGGNVVTYRPPVRLCKQAQLVRLPVGGKLPGYDGIPLFLSAVGPVFTQPGTYYVSARLTGINGTGNSESPWVPIRIRTPDRATEGAAHLLWSRPGVLRALYLRHPLTALDAWRDTRDRVSSAKLAADNTTLSYMNYVAALGWLTPFATPERPEKPPNVARAASRMEQTDPTNLPSGVDRRKKWALEEAKKQRAPIKRAISYPRMVPTRAEETARVEVAPGGLFGSVGLVAETPKDLLDPFARVVSTLRGKRRFADVVSWNIEHLHSEREKIPKVAELIRSFRCDFWGVQEVDRGALVELRDTINSSGVTRYDFHCVEDGGQQCGALFRTDTTRVRRLPTPDAFFTQTLEVPMRDGQVKTKEVFYRKPFLCDVHVYQSGYGEYDFRCAIVHLKSTDFEIADKGDALRAAAAAELARWIKHDMASGEERDYLILGDMNAETANQGLGPFTGDAGLSLLSVGMQDKYGKAEALTRVASKRLLDHIVVTSAAFWDMPEVDKDEQIIVRADTKIDDFTTELSDHVPVAVRFVLGEDTD